MGSTPGRLLSSPRCSLTSGRAMGSLCSCPHSPNPRIFPTCLGGVSLRPVDEQTEAERSPKKVSEETPKREQLRGWCWGQRSRTQSIVLAFGLASGDPRAVLTPEGQQCPKGPGYQCSGGWGGGGSDSCYACAAPCCSLPLCPWDPLCL